MVETGVRRVAVFAQLLPDTGLGDLVMRNGLFALVRRRYPDAHTTLVIGANDAADFDDFLRHHALVDEVLPCPPCDPEAPPRPDADADADPPDHEFVPCPEYDAPPPEFAGEWGTFLDEIRGRRFDVCVVDAATMWLHARAARDAGIPTRIGLLRGHPDEELLTASAPIVARDGHGPDLADFVAAYATALGLEPPPPDAVVPPFPFRADGPTLTVPRPRIAMHIGGRPSWNRRWPLDKYVALCTRLLSTRDCSIVLVGAGEQAQHEQLLAGVDERLRWRICEVGAGSLARTATAMSECDLFAGSDSGPMHVAAALRLPTIALYGPDESEYLWKRVYVDHHPIARRWPCRLMPHTFATREFASCEHGCRYAFRPEAPEYPRCVADITVDEVAAAVTAVLDRVAGPAQVGSGAGVGSGLASGMGSGMGSAASPPSG